MVAHYGILLLFTQDFLTYMLLRVGSLFTEWGAAYWGASQIGRHEKGGGRAKLDDPLRGRAKLDDPLREGRKISDLVNIF